MPFGFHGLDLVVILVIALLIFGPKKLPEMGSAIGKSIKEFRKGMSELTSPKEKEEEPKSSTITSYEALERELASRRETNEARARDFSRETSSEEADRERQAE
jgi:sec-independent protein translocase protein TatA